MHAVVTSVVVVFVSAGVAEVVVVAVEGFAVVAAEFELERFARRPAPESVVRQ